MFAFANLLVFEAVGFEGAGWRFLVMYSWVGVGQMALLEQFLQRQDQKSREAQNALG